MDIAGNDDRIGWPGLAQKIHQAFPRFYVASPRVHGIGPGPILRLCDVGNHDLIRQNIPSCLRRTQPIHEPIFLFRSHHCLAWSQSSGAAGLAPVTARLIRSILARIEDVEVDQVSEG